MHRYSTKDVKNILDGNILDQNLIKIKIIFERNSCKKARSALLNKIDESKLFIYGLNNNKHVITVITILIAHGV